MKKLLSVILVICMVGSLSAPAYAADSVWDGSTANDLWGTADNWTPATVPIALGNTALFNNAPLAGTTTIDLGGAAAVSNIYFNNDSTTLSAYTIGKAADTLTVDNGGAFTLANNVVNTQTIAAAVVLSGSYGFCNNAGNGSGGRMEITDPNSVTGPAGAGNTLTLKGTNTDNNLISGIIANGANALAVLKSEDGTWSLYGDNTYSGGTTITEGTLNISSNKALGTGKLTIGPVTEGGVVTLGNTSTTDIDLTNDNVIDIYGSFAYTSDDDLDLGDGAMTLFGSGGVTVTTAGSIMTVSGDIGESGGNFSLEKKGAGTVTLSGTNTYSGGSILTAGTVNINNARALGTGPITIANGTTIDNTSTSSLMLTSTGAQTWNGNFTFTGTQFLDLGTGTVALGAATRTVTVTNIAPATLTVGGVISGGAGAGLTKTGAGILTLTGANNYTGTTTVTQGILSIAGTSSLPGWSDTGSYSVANGATLAVRNAVTDANITAMLTTGNFAAGSAIGFDTDSGDRAQNATLLVDPGVQLGVTKIGAHDLTLSLANTYTGVTSIIYGILNAITSADALGVGAASVTIYNGATLQLAGHGDLNFARNVTVTGTGSGIINSDRLEAGAGTTNTLGTLTIGANTLYTGFADTASSGTQGLTFGNVTLNGSDGATTEFRTTLGAGGAAGLLTLGGVSGNNRNLEFAAVANTGITVGAITTTTGTVMLLDENAGTVTMNGANTYTGQTAVNSGTLKAGAINAFSEDSIMTVLAAGTIDLNDFNNKIHSLSGAAGSDLLLGAATLTTGFAGDTEFAGAISETGNLIKEGAGKLTLSGANTYTGTTTINEGTLALTGGSAIADTGAVTLANAAGAKLLLNNSETIGSLAGGGALGGNVDLNGANTLTVGDANDTTFSGIISGALGALTKVGAGKLTLNGANTYTGLTTVSAGTLAEGASGSIDNAGALTVNGATAIFDLGNNHSDTVDTVILQGGGSITGTGTSTLTSDANYNMQSGTITAILAGAGIGLDKTTAGTVTLSGLNTYTGVTTISGGTLSINTIADGAVACSLGMAPAAAGNLVLDGGILSYTGNTDSTDRGFTVNATNGEIDVTTAGQTLTIETTGIVTVLTGTLTIGGAGNTTISSAISGPGGVIKDDAGTLTLSGANTYLTSTTVNAGTLVDSGSLADTSDLTVDGATAIFDLGNAHDDTVGTVSLRSGGSITGTGTSTLTSDAAYDMRKGTVTAILAGAVGLNKTTADTVTLSGANTYSGVTDVSAGTLIALTNSKALGAGTLTISGVGAKLQLAGDDNTDFGRNTTVTADSEIDSGRASGPGAGKTHSLGSLTTTGARTLIAGIGDDDTNSGIQGLTFTSLVLGGATIINTGTTLAGGTGLLTLGNVTATNDSLTFGIALAGLPVAITMGTMADLSGGLTITDATGLVTVGNVGTTADGNITITDSTGVTFTGTVNSFGGTGTVAITDTAAASTVAFQGAITADTLTVGAGTAAYNFNSTGTGTTIANAFTPVNTGTMTFGQAAGTQIYTGGIDTTTGGAHGTLTLNGAIDTTSAALKMGAITLGSDTTLHTNAAGVAADITIGAITGAGNDLTLNTGHVAGADISGTTVTSAGGVLTITNAGTATFTGAVDVDGGGTGTVAVTDALTAVAFQGAITADTLTVGAGTAAYNFSSTGTGTTIANAFTPVNTGTMTFGQAAGTQIYTGGIDTTTGGAHGTLTLNGAIDTTSAALKMGAITLGSDTTLHTNAAGVAADITIGAITGAGNDLTLNTGHVAGADISGTTVTSAGGVLTITNAGTATFTGAVDVDGGGTGTVAVTDALTAVAFQGAITADTLTVGAGTAAYNFSSTGTGTTIANAFTPVNTGTMTFGQAAGTQIYTGGIDTTTGGAHGTLTLNGTINTTDTALTLGAVTLGSAVTLDTDDGTANGDITGGAVTSGGNSLTLDSGSTAGATISLTSMANLAGGLTIRDAGGLATIGAIGAGTAGAVLVSDCSSGVTFNSTVAATTLTQTTGAGTTTFNNTVDTTGAADTAGGAVSVTTAGAIDGNSTITTTGGVSTGIGRAGGAVTINSTGSTVDIDNTIMTTGSGSANGSTLAGGKGGDVSITSGANTVNVDAITTTGGVGDGAGTGGAAGSITITATGSTITLEDNITALGGNSEAGSTGGAGGAVTLVNPVTIGGAGIRIDTSGGVGGAANGAGGKIDFQDTLNGTQTLNLDTAGTAAGDIDFDGIVGGTTALGAVTIDDARNVTATTFKAASLVQTAGTLTTLHDDVTTTAAAGVNLTATNIVLDGLNIVTTNAGVARFNGATNLTTAATDIDANGTITFTGALTSTGARNLTLESDANIDFDGAVGELGNVLGAILIDTAVNFTADNTIAATSLHQDAGTWTGLYNNVTTTGASGVDITATNITLDGLNIVTTNAGVARFNGATNLTTAALDIDANGTITFTGALTSTGARNLTLESDANIDFDSTVGGGGNVLGAILVDTAVNLTADNTINATSLVQTAGTLTTLKDTVTTTGAAGVNLTATNIVLDGLNIVTTNAGVARFNGATNLTTAALDIDANGTITFTGALTSTGARNLTLESDANIDFDSTVGAGGNVLGAILVDTAVNLTADNTINATSLVQTAGTLTTLKDTVTTTGAAGVNLTATNIVLDGLNIVTTNAGVARFNGATNLTTAATDIDANGTITFTGALTSTGARNLTLESDANIDFDSTVGGGGNVLGAILVDTAVNLTADNTITGTSLVQTAGTLTTLKDTVTTTGASGVDITATNIVLDGLNIVTTNAGVARFNGATDLTTAATDIDANGTITFTGALTSTTAQNLTLESDANIDFDDAVGAGGAFALGAILIDTAVNFTADNTIAATSLHQDAGTWTGLYNNVTTTGASGVDITATNITLDGLNIVTTNAGVARFNGATNLTTAATDIDANGTITFTGALTSVGAQENLTLESDANIDFDGTVGAGGLTLGAILIDTAVNVTADNTITGTSLVQTAGTLTTLKDTVTTTGAAGVNLTATNIVLDGLNIVTTNAGVARFNGATNLTTAATDIDANGTITFTGALTSTGARNLTLESDANIDFDSTVGGGGNVLGAILVDTAVNLTADNTITGTSLVQTAGTLTTLKDTVTTTGASGVDITATNIVLDGLTIDTSAGNGVARFNGAVALSSGAVALTSGTGNVDFTSTIATGGQLLTVTNTGASVATLADAVTGAGALTKAGTGTLTLNGSNTYEGITTLNQGTIILGNNNALGTGAGAILTLGGAGTIQSSNDARSVSNAVDLATNTLTVSGANNLALTGAISSTGGGGALTVNMTGAADTLTLSNTDTYSGTTTVSAGTLALSNASNNNIASSATINVAAGAGLNVTGLDSGDGLALANGQTLKGSGTVTGDLSIGTGSILKPGNSPGTINDVGDVTYAGGGTYIWEINDATGTVGTDPGWDLQNITGGLTITSAVGNAFTIDITGLKVDNTSGIVPNFVKTNSYEWTIASTTTGITGFDVADFTLATANFVNNNSIHGAISDGFFAIQLSGNDLQLKYNAAVDDAAYWKGGVNTEWNKNGGVNGNWATDSGGGTDYGKLPSATTAVFFTTDASGNYATTLGQNFSILSLNLGTGAGATNSVTIGGINTLTIGAGGITVQSGSVAHEISSDVTLGAAESWTNNSANLLTISGTVTNGANLLTVAGAGNTDISGDVSGSGGLTKTGAGTLILDNVLNAISGNFTLTTTGVNDVTIVNTLATNIAASSIGDDLTVTTNTAGGDITDSGTVTVGGDASFTASAAGDDINLGTLAVTGKITLNTNGAGANATIVNATGIDFNASTIGGNLAVTAGGDITQTGALAVTGTTTITNAGFDVTLGDVTNNFVGAVSVTGVDVALVDAGAIDLGASTVTGTYAATATAAGNITNTGALAITGASTFTAATGRSITVANAGNSFGGTVTFVGTGGSLLNVSVLDTTALDLKALTLTGDLTATGAGLTQTGALVVPGTSTFTSTGAANDILLDNAANNFGTAVVTSGRDATLVDAGAVILGAHNITRNLAWTAGGDITQTGALAVTGTTTITNAGFDVTLGDVTNNFVGAVSVTGVDVALVDAGAIDLGASTVTGTYAATATAAGNITNTGALAITGASTFTAATGRSITVANAGNSFGGTVTFVGTGGSLLNVSVLDTTALDLKALTLTGDLTATGAGLTQTGALVVPGTSTFTSTGAANDILLDNAANNFGTAVVTSGRDATLVDAGAVILGAHNITRNLAWTAGGDITQTGALAVTGTTTITNAGFDVTLGDVTNNFVGAVSVTGGDVALVDAGAIDLGASTVTGTYAATATAAGNITNTGALAITGASTFTAATGRSITVANAGNSFGGTVTFVGTGGSLLNVSVLDTTALDLKALTLTGDLTATGAGLTQTGALVVPGTSTFTSTGAANDILLDNAANNFGTAVVTSGRDATLVDAGAVILGAHNITRNLAWTAGGDITQTGALAVTGTTTITNAGFDVTLGDVTNNFVGAVSVTGVDVALVDAGAIDLGASTVTGTYAATATAAGNITNTGALAITGASTFTAATGRSITVANAGNSFGGTVTFVGTGGSLLNVSVLDTTALDLKALTLTGDLTATGAGLTQTGALVVPGTSTFTSTGAANDILLDNAANNFGTAVVTSGRDATLVDAGAVILGAHNITRNLAWTAGGDITQTGALAVTGTTTITNAGFDVTLGDVTNNFVGAVSVTGVDVALVDAGAIDLGASTVTGTYAATATAAGNITNTGALAITGASTFTAATGRSITVANAGNSFGGTVTFVGTGGSLLNVSVLDTTALDLKALTLTGDLTATGAGLTQTGALVVPGTSTFTSTGAANDILLDNAANNFGTAVVTSGRDATLVDAGAVILGAHNITRNLAWTAGGDITQTGALAVTGTTTITNAGFDVTLGDVTNNFVGAVSVTGVDVALVDAGAIDLGASTVTGTYAATATAAGNITNTGALAITGASTFTAATGRSITVANAGNSFGGTVTFVGTGGSLLNVSVLDTTALDLKALTLTGDLTATGAGLTQTGALVVPGTSTFTSTGAANDILLDNAANNFGTAVVTSGRDATLVDAGAVILGAHNITRNLAWTAGGDITDNGVLAITGTSNFTTTAAGADITLDQVSTYTGAVSLNTNAAVGSDASLTNANSSLNLGASTVGGIFTIATDAGSITDSGVLAITGASHFTTTAAGADITLDQVSTYTGAVSFNTAAGAGNDVSLTNANAALNLGASTVGGTFTIATDVGDITNSGALAITGASTFTAATGQSITVANAGNSFGGAVTFVGTGGSLLNVSVLDTTALDLKALTITGDLTATGAGLTDSGALVAPGTATFTSTGAANDMLLDNAANNFGTAVVTSGRDATLVDVGAVILGAHNITRDLTWTAGGDITDNGVLAITGTSNFTSTAAGADITLDQVSTYTGAVSFNTAAGAGNDASLTNANSSLNLGASTVGGIFTIATDAGSITDSGVLAITGASHFTTTAAGADITLDQVSTYTGAVSFNTAAGAGNDASLTNANSSLNLGASTVGGIFTIATDAGDITDSGALTITGASSFTTTAVDADIILNSGLAATGAITLSTAGTAGDATVVNTVGTTLAASTIGGDLDVNSSNNTLAVAGALSTAAANGLLTLNAGANTLTTNAGGTLASGLGTTTLTGTTIDLNDNVTTSGGTVDLNVTTTTLDLAAGKSITTTAVGAVSGNIDIDTTVAGSTANLAGDLATTGALNGAGAGYNGGAVAIDTTNGVIAVNNITTTGGAGTGAAGGAAGNITLNTSNNNIITLNGNLTAEGGAGTAQGAGGVITVADPALLGAAVTISSGTGNINLTSVDTGGNLLTVANTGASAAAITGIVTGTGALTKNGTGTLTLGGANDYTGTTTINGGMLDLTGTLADTGAVVLADAATASLRLNGNETIGSLAGGGAAGGNVNLNGANTLTVGNANSTTYGGIISDGGLAGGLTKVGAGTLTFSPSHHTYTGATTINAGTLAIGGATTIGGDITHNLTSTLNLGANTLTLDGAGALGNYTQTGTPTLKTTIQNVTVAGNIDASTAGSGIMTTVAASILSVTVPTATEIPVGTKWIILNGQGVGGVIAPTTVTSSNPRVSFTAVATNGAGGVGTQDLELTVSTWNTADAYFNAATSANGRAAGTALGAITNPTGDILYVLDTLDTLSDSQISAALETMIPEIDAGVINTTTTVLNNFIGVAMNRVENVLTIAKSADSAATGFSAGDAGKINGIWGKGYGSYLTQGTRNGTAGYDAWNAGTAIGIDRLFSDIVTLGISGGYAYGDVDSDVNNANTYINSAQVTVYGGYQDRELPYFIDAAMVYAYNWYNGERDINVGNVILRTANASYDGQQYGAYIGGGYKFNVTKNIEFTPLMSLQWNRLHLESYTETQAGALNLAVASQDYDQLQSGLGARIAAPMKYKWGTFTPEAHGKWFYDFIGDAMVVTSTFTGGGPSFNPVGTNPAVNSFNAGGQLIFDFKNDVSIIGNCDTEIKDEFFGIYGSLTLRYDF